MTLRNRLTLISSLTFGVVFAFAGFAVYYTFQVTSERIIFSELQKTGLLSAMFYLDEDELSTREHNRIRADFEAEMQQTDVKVYDGGNQLRYGNGQSKAQVTTATLRRAREEGRLQFRTGENYFHILHYPDNQGDFVVVVASSNTFFLSQRTQLLAMMGIALGAGLIIIFLLSRWLSRLAYQPISSVIDQVTRLQADNLDTALTLPRAKDELHDLVSTFNGLLSRLADTFVIQKNFINYVSHEFKTPLAAITGNLEVFGKKDRTPAEYHQVSQTVLAQASQLERILNNLMILAGLRGDPLRNATYRVDDMLWAVLNRIFERWPAAKQLITVQMAVSQPEKLVTTGNGNQLQLAVFNLVDNAVKYADSRTVSITLEQRGQSVRLTIKDNGRGIAAEELPSVHQPFYRGSNIGETKGSGIGLSLAVLICKQNGVSFSLTSEADRGTTAILEFGQL